MLHARGKIIQDSRSIPGVSAPVIPPGGEENQALYARALRCGFEFGPRYRQLARAVRVDASTIEVELTDQTADVRFGLDPCTYSIPASMGSFFFSRRARAPPAPICRRVSMKFVWPSPERSWRARQFA